MPGRPLVGRDPHLVARGQRRRDHLEGVEERVAGTGGLQAEPLEAGFDEIGGKAILGRVDEAPAHVVAGQKEDVGPHLFLADRLILRGPLLAVQRSVYPDVYPDVDPDGRNHEGRARQAAFHADILADSFLSARVTAMRAPSTVRIPNCRAISPMLHCASTRATIISRSRGLRLPSAFR